MSNPLLTNKFPEVLDATMLIAYRGCPQHFKKSYVDNWKPTGESIHLIAGGAFAKGTEMSRRAFYDEHLSQDDAQAAGLEALITHYGDFQPPEKAVKTLDRMCGALEFYYENYPLLTDQARVACLGGVNAVEFNFAIPLPILHPQTGNPLIYSGACDAVVDYAGGLYAMDEKTTSQLGASWSKQWDLRFQFTGYAWALREHGFKSAGTIVRGVSILKTKYETQQAVVGQEEWKIDRWYKQMLIRVNAMVNSFTTGEYEYDLGESCNAYGGCPFKTVCLAPKEEPWLEGYFVQKEWLPLERK